MVMLVKFTFKSNTNVSYKSCYNEKSFSFFLISLTTAYVFMFVVTSIKLIWLLKDLKFKILSKIKLQRDGRKENIITYMA
jgi:hypothetical protein